MSMNAAAPRRRSQRILLVDDNPENLTLLSALLDLRGYSVFTAGTAEAAHEMISRQAPDLVLLDVILPGRSGYELCRELKENDSGSADNRIGRTGRPGARHRSRRRRFPQ